MPAEWVLDASVAVKCFITEPGSEAARRLVGSGVRIVAPEFVFAEIASVATKRARRGDIERAFAEEITASAPDLFDATYPVGPLASRAQELSFDHNVSVYDALYVALAESLEIAVMTADLRLNQRLQGSVMSARIQVLENDEGDTR